MAGPLSGVKIVDLSTVLMAPYATQIMGDMGADVIKIEAPTGDPIRGIGPCRNDGMGAIFQRQS
jgi:crotonobetainyl-CoA:carnitine CoA-transferase CaiB-like acyl-CoA transferase